MALMMAPFKVRALLFPSSRPLTAAPFPLRSVPCRAWAMPCEPSARRLAEGTCPPPLTRHPPPTSHSLPCSVITSPPLMPTLHHSPASFFFSVSYSTFHRVVVIGSLSLHSDVMNAVCQIAQARYSESSATKTDSPDGRTSPLSPPTFSFTSSIIPPLACISTTMHSHMARALFWDSEFRCHAHFLPNFPRHAHCAAPCATPSPAIDAFLSMLSASTSTTDPCAS